MGDIDIKIDVSETQKIPLALKKGVVEGLKDSGAWMLDEGEDKAKDVVMSADRVWRKTLKQGFTSQRNQFSRHYHWQGHIRNNAPHAEVNEDGLKPGTTPPVQRLIPWVDDKFSGGLSRVTTTSYNVENWDPALQELAAQYSPGKVITSFAVQDKLEKEGYPGIGFMETTETYLERVGPAVVKRKIEKHMQRELREADLM